MSVRQVVDYCPTLKQVIGPHSKLQDAIVRGIKSKWKQLVFYNFDTPMTKDLLFSLIKKLEESNVRVRAVVSDMGNHTLQKELHLKVENSFSNPFDCSRITQISF